VKIWLINAYGPIPLEGWRDYRYTIIGNVLSAAGHDVLWWTSNFSHHFKRFRSEGWEDRTLSPRFRIRLVPTPGYSRNIGLARLRNELAFICRTYMRARREGRPDCIVVTDPPQTVGRLGVWLAGRWHCPLIFDVMDLWPELFALALPRRLRGLAPIIFSPMYLARKRNYSHADGLIALSQSYTDKMLAEVPRLRAAPVATVFNGIDVEAFREAMRESANGLHLPNKGAGEIWAVYAGSLGENYDVSTLMEAAVLLENRGVAIRILVAGDGPRAAALQAFVRERQLGNLIYLGSVSKGCLPGLYRQCDIGISAYGPSSTVAMPDKAYDYMAAGLPMVNSLRGELAALIDARQCGLNYAAGDPLSLAATFETLATDHNLRRAMARSSFEAGNDFDRRAQYGCLPALVEKVCLDWAAVKPTIRTTLKCFLKNMLCN